VVSDAPAVEQALRHRIDDRDVVGRGAAVAAGTDLDGNTTKDQRTLEARALAC